MATRGPVSYCDKGHVAHFHSTVKGTAVFYDPTCQVWLAELKEGTEYKRLQWPSEHEVQTYFDEH